MILIQEILSIVKNQDLIPELPGNWKQPLYLHIHLLLHPHILSTLVELKYRPILILASYS